MIWKEVGTNFRLRALAGGVGRFSEDTTDAPANQRKTRFVVWLPSLTVCKDFLCKQMLQMRAESWKKYQCPFIVTPEDFLNFGKILGTFGPPESITNL